ncbi:WD40 repeat stress protein/actin interacting protein [Ceraceosorus bombacis]|uniref:WD40 repeat stress protein/actin interacting protein n=1 Tax=Ceraceosorus bombacis TaxID=401625 RepID=A0A0P1BP19_9BASI|nr:WD40 repeat stress protein/actin interacting protein [Ceraceosorus bombacis]
MATAQYVYPPNPTTTRASSTPIAWDAVGKRLVYPCGRLVVLRDLISPTKSKLYGQHTTNVTVARVSPNGYYCASADAAGNIRVWDLAGEEMILKLEKKALSGPIRDLAWDGESKRIAAVGEGKESFGAFFLADSGSSCGEVTGHSKALNSVAIKPQRPFKAVLTGDDNAVVFYAGVPFKYNSTQSVHTRFVQSVSYAPTGTFYVSAGSDGKLQLYDGTSGTPTAALTDSAANAAGQAHAGTIFATSVSADGSLIASAGADASVKVWDAATQKLKHTFDLKNASGGGANDQLVGVTFADKGEAVALALGGALHVLRYDESAPSALKTLHAPTRAIGTGAFAVVDGELLSGSFDGRIISTSLDGHVKQIQATGAAVTGIAAATSSLAWVIGMDDTVRRYSNAAFDSTAVATSGQARSLAGSSSVAVVATSSGLDILNGSPVQRHQQKLDFDATAVGLYSDGQVVAIGGEDGKVRLGSVANGAFKQTALLENGRRGVTALAFSPDGSLLAAGEAGGRIMVYDVKDAKLKLNQWTNHTARVSAIAFSQDGKRAVSSSLDTNVIVWSVDNPFKHVAIKNAHAGGANGAVWLDASTVASAGADGSIRSFKIPPAQS